MEQTFPKQIRFTRPSGGLFLWVELPESVDAKEVLVKSLEYKVAFVPGEAFFPNQGRKNTFRLNYSNMSEERIIEGIKRLAVVLESYCS
jgi:DNA-binding transcriptional MocR family regulator